GVYCSEHDWLLNQVLRGDWGFAGAVVTDWGAANDRVRGIAAGLDLEMPASGGVNDRRLVAAVRDGRLPEADLDRAVTRNLSLALLGGELPKQRVAMDQDAHHALARRAAGECAVLLKNEGALLPLAPGARIAVIGAFAKQPRYQGAGSSQVNPTRLDCAFDAIAATVGDGASLDYAPGYDPKHSEPDAALVAEAAAAAAEAEVAVVFAGLPGSYESEGFDRSHMALPEQHDRLIAAVCEANPNTVVVLSNGAPVAMPWVAAPKAILEGYLAGQGGGAAMADVLFGRVNPSGKLAETFPLQQADVPADRWFPGTGRQVHYREGLHVGYRYFDTAAAPVLFPFGHGLSYTRFEYGDLELSADAFAQGGELAVSFALTNSGDLAGSEVVQLYAHAAQSSVHRPEQELRAFTKVALAPGETRRVTLTLDDAAFAVYDTDAGKWIVEAGEFEIRLGASSRDIRLRTRLKVQSSQSLSAAARGVGGLDGSDEAFAALLGKPVPPPEPSRPYHLNSSLGEIGETALGRFIRSKVASGFQKRMGVKAGDEATARMFEAMANNMPLRSLALFSGGRLSFNGLAALVALLNHRLLTALRLLLRRSDDGFPG
ncbi:MAG: glycosyl hydrolase, partial [Gammaproteobacteria bacterium]|nr:glycosyl hydrolase [Gammaproteobacteria bacterium]